MSKKSLEDSYRMCFWSMVVIIALLVLMLLTGCTTTEYVPVVQTHEQHHWHTDSVKEKDSIYHENTTIIQQLDSAEMAKYGIQLKAAERAWLVKTAELERQIQQLSRLTQDRDTVRDSVPVPYPVKEYIEKPLTKTQIAMMVIGFICTFLVVAYIGRKIRGLLP